MLFDAMEDLDEHRYDAFQDANEMLFVSKDAARTLLAFVYCNQKKFDKALPLLEEVIRRDDYHLEYTKEQNIRTMQNVFGAITYRQEAERHAILALITKM